MDLLAEDRPLSEVEMARCKALRSQFWAWLQHKEQYWVQMARSKAMKCKDKNTKFFHTIATFKKSRKCIKILKCEKGLVSNPRGIKKEVTKYFKKLYMEDKSVCLRMGIFEGNCLTTTQAQGLEVMPTAEEVKKAVWACESSKSPGYDGFNFGFLKNMWDTVGKDLTKSVLSFFQSGTLAKGLNTT